MKIFSPEEARIRKNVGAREYSRVCRERNRERYNANQAVLQRRLRKENPEKHREYQRLWRELNRERRNAQARLLRKENPKKYRRMSQKYQNKQRERAEFRMRGNLRSRIYQAIRGVNKSAGTIELLGMDLKEFKIYIQGQFRPGMTWENYGPVWHIDHVRPCASFDLSNPAQQRECFHWSNLQPLFAADNIRKGAKYGD